MKKISILSIAIFWGITLFAQNNIEQVLLPQSFLLPTRESIKLNTFWYDTSGLPYKGLGNQANGNIPLPPQWYINGKPENAQSFSDGVLTVDPSLQSATYLAPLGIPAKNPVAISVSFADPNDIKKTITLVSNITIVEPGKNWYVTYTYSGAKNTSSKSGDETYQKKESVTGTASLLIKPDPADEAGFISIVSEQGAGTIINSSISGTLSQKNNYVSKDMAGNIDKKNVRTCTGTVSPGRGGIEFQYDPTQISGEQITFNAGFSFDLTGKDIWWKKDSNGKLKEIVNAVDEKQAEHFLLGSSNDIIHKIPNGFIIDYHSSKDTSYTSGRFKNHDITKEDYHFIIKKRYIKEKEKLPLEPLVNPKLPLLPLVGAKLPLEPLVK